MERVNAATVKGNPVTLLGNELKAGDRAPDFTVADSELKDISLTKFKGKIKLIGGIRKDLETLYGIEILESVETPGLGGEIVKDEFKRQFSGRRFYKSLNCIKGGAAIEKHAPPPRGIIAVTGATISSQSVVNILNEKVKRLRGILRR